MKNFLYYLELFLDESYNEIKGKALIAPVVVAGIISGAATIGTKIAADIKAKRAAKDLDEQARLAKITAGKEADKVLSVARGVVKEGDPTLNAKLQAIDESAANTLGKVTATSGSTQEIINAAQGVQRNKDVATATAQTQASQFGINAKKLLSERFVSAAQLKLGGNAAIDAQMQAALAAIGANAQASVDTAQNLGSQGIQAASFFENNKQAVTG